LSLALKSQRKATGKKTERSRGKKKQSKQTEQKTQRREGKKNRGATQRQGLALPLSSSLLKKKRPRNYFPQKVGFCIIFLAPSSSKKLLENESRRWTQKEESNKRESPPAL
jgi:hypothetical protein